MKLRTSFFKPVTLKKDIFRFAPVWALYLIGLMMFLLETGSHYDYDNYANVVLPDLITAFGVVNLCYAALCANLLFGDLYNTKLCYSLHAMPYRRESWLLTHLASGLLFSLVPNAVATLYLMLRLDAYWFLGLYWYLAVTLQFVFFYGIATVSAMLTGNRLAMLLVYAGFNFVAMLLYATVYIIYIPMFVGVAANITDFSRFSPVVQLFQHDFFTFTRIENNASDLYHSSKYFYRFDGLADGWGYSAILGGVGLAAMAISLWLYRIRHLESAGDFVAFPRIKPVACVIITLCVALCFALVGEAMGSGYILWLIVGMIVGYFGAMMLLERRIKVFRKKTLLGFIALVVAVVISLCAVGFDWFGIESWTPKADRVASVIVTNRGSYDYNYEYGGGLRVTLEDPADIAKIIDAHQDILGRMDEMEGNGGKHRVTLVYKMKSGRTVVRSYYAPASGENYEIIRQYLYSTQSVLGFTDVKEAAKTMTFMYSDKGKVPPSLYETVLEALLSDCANGQVLSNASGEHYFDYEFTDSEGKIVRRNLVVKAGAEKTIALMKGPQIQMGYGNWDTFLSDMTRLGFASEGLPNTLPEDQWEDLLIALRKDVEAGTVKSNHYASDAIVVYYELRYGNGEYEYREFYISEKAEYTNDWLVENLYIPAG